MKSWMMSHKLKHRERVDNREKREGGAKKVRRGSEVCGGFDSSGTLRFQG